jgi:multicomponent K+:H+ antiporter subunit A
MGVGLLLVLAAGAGAIALGDPLLTSRTIDVYVPVVGAIHLGSVMLFDLGIFTLVLGAMILILVAIAHQSRRARHAGPGPGGA